MKFGDIKELQLSEYFKTEDGYFTPCVKENIGIIGMYGTFEVLEKKVVYVELR